MEKHTSTSGGFARQLGIQRAAATRVAKLLLRNSPSHFNYAVTLHDLGRVEEAIEAYQEAVRLDPQFADAHFNLAVLFEQRDDRELAVEHMAIYREVSGDADLKSEVTVFH